MRPNLYLAGKISKNDWRHGLIPGLRGHVWSDGPIVTPEFSYVGPFFVSCDHGCNHAPNSHGAAAGFEYDESTYDQSTVVKNNMQVLATADLVFAYITAPDCYGTLGEIGWALGRRKRVVMAFSPDVKPDDFWFWGTQAHAMHVTVRECCLEGLLREELTSARTTP